MANHRAFSLLFVVGVLTFSPTSVLGQNLAAVIAEKETFVQNLATAAKATFSERCSYKCTDQCSAYACGKDNSNDGATCSSELGTGPCESESCDSMNLNFDKTVVRYPFSSALDDELKTALCSFADPRMVNAMKDNRAKGQKAWQYYSSSTGATAVYPGHGGAFSIDDGKCSDWDPRIRPW